MRDIFDFGASAATRRLDDELLARTFQKMQMSERMTGSSAAFETEKKIVEASGDAEPQQKIPTS